MALGVSRSFILYGVLGGLFGVICRPVDQPSTFDGFRLNFCNDRVTDRKGADAKSGQPLIGRAAALTATA